ncbi:hypothetical protein KFL_010300030 [Klebsormidium nitens]|uniref:Uncharacterized protein n=1 Tax=Klebsormidium nitens TaxID=105231 RepID=A0A1Y1ISJ2_KLENI|nr:hypothetical protein KFL_010300030 [Klebsormidium nitens]|eukprot:GAQ92499.1 hypothetical protein KFL_010300030 [Klebsormidium nitens]
MLMQKEQKLNLELGSGLEALEENEDESAGKAFVAKRERYGVIVAKGSSKRGVTEGGRRDALNTKNCYACGEKSTSGPIAGSGTRSASLVSIEGLGGEALTALGIEKVVWECKTPNGARTVNLGRVLARSGSEGERGCYAESNGRGCKGIARFETEGVVRMEAVQHGRLWEIATVKKARAFLAVKAPAEMGRRIREAARKPQVVVGKKRVEVKPVNYIEMDEVHPVNTETEPKDHGAMEAVGASAKDMEPLQRKYANATFLRATRSRAKW